MMTGGIIVRTQWRTQNIIPPLTPLTSHLSIKFSVSVCVSVWSENAEHDRNVSVGHFANVSHRPVESYKGLLSHAKTAR